MVENEKLNCHILNKDVFYSFQLKFKDFILGHV
jgi:hypothetical protein